MTRSVLDVAFVAAFVAWTVITLAYVISVGRLYARLKHQHPAVYEALGRPSLFFRNTPWNNLLRLRWLWKREFEALRDAETTTLARRVVPLLLLELAAFALVVVLLVAGA